MTVLRGTNTVNGTLPNACNLVATTTGGTETSKTTTFTGTSTDAEIFSQGGTTATASSASTPSGHGWCYQPGAGSYAAANWSAIITLSSISIGRTVTVSFYKYTGTYSSIGSISFTNTPTAKTANSFTATSMPATTFGSSDLLYVHLNWHDASSNAGGDNPTVYVSNSSSLGVVNDMQITTSTFTPSIAAVTDTLQTRVVLATKVTKTLQSRVRIATRLVDTLQVRFLEKVNASRTLVTRFVMTRLSKTLQARIRIATQRVNTLQARFLERVQATRTLQARIVESTKLTRTLQARFLERVQTTRALQARFIYQTLGIIKTLVFRFIERTQVGKTLQARARVATKLTRTLQSRARVATKLTRTLQARFLERTQTSKVLPTRIRVSTKRSNILQARLVMVRVMQVLQVRARVATIKKTTLPIRVRIATIVPQALQVRFLERVQATKTLLIRFRSRVLLVNVLQARTRLSVKLSLPLQVRFLERVQIAKTLQFRIKIPMSIVRSLQFRVRTRVKKTTTLQFRVRLIAARLNSGGFALFANGPGSASFDNFRVVEYPDPALSLAPIVPRLGFCSVSWNSQLVANTTLGIDASFDGVNWTDISSFNGLPFPLLTAQSPFIVDGFTSTSTTGNYTSTARTGGTPATWTFDVTNSRLIVTGGVNALYISNQVARADVDLYVDFNRSDTGGVVWRYTDANNFYYATFTDDGSTIAQRTLTIYRVVANVQTVLATTTIPFRRTLYTRCRVSMLAGLITVSVDGLVVATYTDGSPLSGLSVGIYSNGGTNYVTQLWVQPQGDYVSGTPPLDTVTGTFVYTRQRLATTDPSVTPYVLDFTVSSANPDISPGAVIPPVIYDYSLVSANIDDLAKQSNFSWYINNREVIFRMPGAVPSPWIIQSAANGLPSWIEPDSNLVVTQANNTLYRNRQILKGVIGTDTFGNSFTSAGNSTSFTLSYPIAAGTVPSITLGGIVQSVGLKGTAGSQWYYAEGDPIIAQDTSGTFAMIPGVLAVSYTGTFALTVIVDNTTAQAALAIVENSSGIVEEVEDVSKQNMYYAAALTYAQQLLARYCLTGRTIVFKTYRPGLDLLQIGTFVFPEFNLVDAQMLITEIDITVQTQPNNTVLYAFTVTATELPNIISWSKLLATNFLSGT